METHVWTVSRCIQENDVNSYDFRKSSSLTGWKSVRTCLSRYSVRGEGRGSRLGCKIKRLTIPLDIEDWSNPQYWGLANPQLEDWGFNPQLLILNIEDWTSKSNQVVNPQYFGFNFIPNIILEITIVNRLTVHNIVYIFFLEFSPILNYWGLREPQSSICKGMLTFTCWAQNLIYEHRLIC